MRTGYFDASAGISGDMILGAMVDAGLELPALRKELKKLNVGGWNITGGKVRRSGCQGTKIDIELSGKAVSVPRLRDALRIIRKSRLSAAAKEKTGKIFFRLAGAEAKVHGVRVDRLHFHEMGSMDTLIDVAGAVLGMELLGLERIYCSPLNVGSGSVSFSHGTFAVPAPATLELLKGIQVYSAGPEAELVTPTGAAIITSLAEFRQRPLMKVLKTGYGAGRQNLGALANFLRLTIGETAGEPEKDTVAVIECNIDDANPQIYDVLMEKLFKAGALDVSLCPVIMKKNRPGILLCVISEPSKSEEMSELILNETPTFGLRVYQAHRRKLQRKTVIAKTPWGNVRVKVGYLPGGKKRFSPEYEDLKKISLKKKIPVEQINRAVQKNIYSPEG